MCLSRVCLRTQLLPACLLTGTMIHVADVSYCVTRYGTGTVPYPCPNNLYTLVPSPRSYPATRALARTTCS